MDYSTRLGSLRRSAGLLTPTSIEDAARAAGQPLGFRHRMQKVLHVGLDVFSAHNQQDRKGPPEHRVKNRLRWDDALDVWGVHGVGGTLGVILLGVFASTAANPAGANGLLHGNAPFFLKETLAVLAAGAYAFVFTWAMLWLINRITPVRISEKDEMGLDEALHGEQAYEM